LQILPGIHLSYTAESSSIFNDIVEWHPSCNLRKRPGNGRQDWSGRTAKEKRNMLYYALVFLLVAVVAAILGFGGLAIVSAGIAKILFFVFIVLFLVSLITHMSRRV
jgi:uncharacterized membrane protein YtjA (UPF0391 family)